MTVVEPVRTVARGRPARSARQVGYAVGALVNGVLLWPVAVEPGWRVMPFLTAEFGSVLGLVITSIAAGIFANLVFLVADAPRLRAAGDILVTGLGLVALIGLWRTFPFTFDVESFDWALLTRVLLGTGIAGSLIGVAVAVTKLAKRPPEGA